MKLKLVVASMSVLGLVSCPVFAATNSTHKHKHHTHHTTAHHDYKDMGALPYKDQPAACMMSQTSMIMTDMGQNNGRAMATPCNPGWFNRIAMAGGGNFDFGKFGSRGQNFMGENYRYFSLNDAYLNISSDVNEWVKFFASASFNNPTSASVQSTAASYGAIKSEYSAAYSNNIGTSSSANPNNKGIFTLEQVYATASDMDSMPFYVKGGKYFQDFGRYEIHPITRSLTQSMSETLATALGAGFVTNGFSGEVFAFDNPISLTGQTKTSINYGAGLGYNQMNSDLGWDLGVGYMRNLMGANDIAYVVNQRTTLGGYDSQVSGTAVYADVNSGPFSIGARYTAALQSFNSLDIAKNVGNLGTGAQPWAAGIQAGYGFDMFSKNNNVYLGYQASNEALYLNLPRNRWVVGYGVDAFGKNTNLGIEWDRDSAYSTGTGGSGSTYNLVSLRSSVRFG